MKLQLQWLLIPCIFTACTYRQQDITGKTVALHTAVAPHIDGFSDELMWKDAAIYPIDQLWDGKLPFASDYMGRFRACWDSGHLYVLVEIMDDSLIGKEDHIDIFFGNELTDQAPDHYAVYADTDTSVTIKASTDSMVANEHFVKRKVNTHNNVSTWEISIASANTGRSTIPFGLFYTDTDKPKATSDRMGNIPIRPDPKKSRQVIYADDLGELSLETLKHK
jgi:hypothetical protein